MSAAEKGTGAVPAGDRGDAREELQQVVGQALDAVKFADLYVEIFERPIQLLAVPDGDFTRADVLQYDGSDPEDLAEWIERHNSPKELNGETYKGRDIYFSVNPTIATSQLRMIAARRMDPERSGHTLQATALVNEAYLRLVGDDGTEWSERRHFFATASEAMRRILVEHARRTGARKRGGGVQNVALGANDISIELDLERMVDLNEALGALEQEDERAAAVARLRFLSGRSVEETAEALSMSIRSVHREWAFARARLFQLMGLDPNS